MQTKTDFTFTLSEEETREAVWRYLRDVKQVATPVASKEVTVKWTSKGEARVSFTTDSDFLVIGTSANLSERK